MTLTIGPFVIPQSQGVRVALTREEAAKALGMSLDSFERYVQPTVPMLRLGRMRLVPVKALVEWCDRNAETSLP